MEDAINHDSSLLGSADAQVEEKPDGVCGDTNDLPITPWTEEPSIDCADKKDKKEKLEKKERKEKKEESSRDWAESVGKCLQESFIPLPASNSQVGNDSDSDSIVSAENGSNSGVCHDDHESDSTPEAEAAPLEALEVPCMKDAINHESSLLGSADAQVEEKPDGVCGDTNGLPITPWTEEPSIDLQTRRTKRTKTTRRRSRRRR